jgi:guanylate kinase
MAMIARRGLCLVLAAPSGAGKTAITEALVASESLLTRSISVTTRAPRPGEIDGVHYHFMTEARFRDVEQAGELLEWARVLQGTHAYGTPRGPVAQALAAGRDLVFDIDWQGHRALREKLAGDVVGVFILPPDLAVLEDRLRRRAGEDNTEITRRMQLARDEIAHWSEFDYVVVNNDLPVAVEAVRAILRAERLRADRQTGTSDFVARLGLPPRNADASTLAADPRPESPPPLRTGRPAQRRP